MTPALLSVPLVPIVLRDYQSQGIHSLREAMRTTSRRVLLVMPTGAGKTATAADMVRSASEKNSRQLWLVDRVELVEQAAEAFARAGVQHGYILPDREPSKFDRAWIGTIQTFLARVKSEKWVPEQVDLIIIDEAHRTANDSYQTALALYPTAYVVGLTATPVRGDGKGLGNTYGAMVQPTSIQALLESKNLIPPRYYVPSQIDLSAVKARVTGDYTREERKAIAEANPQLVGDAVETFARFCPDRRAVAFPSTIAQSIDLRNRFSAAGIPACHIDGTTPKGERKALMDDFRAGVYQMLTSVNIAIEGLDVPDVSCVIMLRPTKSERLWVQAVGRGLRAYEGQTDCIVLDHAGVLAELGPAEDYGDWSLEFGQGNGKKSVSKPSKDDKGEPKPISCEACNAAFYASCVCPECGHVHLFERGPKPLKWRAGDLEELTPTGRKERTVTAQEKQVWYAMLLRIAKGNDKRAGAMFNEKFGHYPARKHGVQQMAPSQEVLACVQSQQIAYRARMNKAKQDALAEAAD